MVKDQSDSERGNPPPTRGLLFPISSNGMLYMHHLTDRIAHTTVCVALAGTKINLSMGPIKKDRSVD